MDERHFTLQKELCSIHLQTEPQSFHKRVFASAGLGWWELPLDVIYGMTTPTAVLTDPFPSSISSISWRLETLYYLSIWLTASNLFRITCHFWSTLRHGLRFQDNVAGSYYGLGHILGLLREIRTYLRRCQSTNALRIWTDVS